MLYCRFLLVICFTYSSVMCQSQSPNLCFFVFLNEGDYYYYYYYYFKFMAVLRLRFCARAFSSCGKRGPFFIAVCGPLLLQSTGSRPTGSVIVAHGPSCSTACGILPDQGSNPCPLHWQADSQPLCHQGNPCFFFHQLQSLFIPHLVRWQCWHL